MSTAITAALAHRGGNVELAKLPRARFAADEHTEAFIQGRGMDLPANLDAQDAALDCEIKLAARCYSQVTADLRGNDDLAFVGNGDDGHAGSI